MGDLPALRRSLSELDRVVVAFSGGADSSLLAWVANDTLGPERVLCVTALSPSLARQEEVECRSLAAEWGLRWRGVPTDEMEDAAYVTNGADRCAHCKGALMDVLVPLAGSSGSVVVLGVNVDDLGDHRPGQRARGARGPVPPGRRRVHQVRRAGVLPEARPAHLGQAGRGVPRVPYPLWDPGDRRPAPLGRPRRVGPPRPRRPPGPGAASRHHGPHRGPRGGPGTGARARGPIVERFRAVGFLHVAMDLEGYRSGSLNRAWRAPPGSPRDHGPP